MNGIGTTREAVDTINHGHEMPLVGIRVLEFGHMIMGPSCGMILADLGAEVIKIEPQGTGDKSRALGALASGFHCTYNRNKKSISIDFKSKNGREAVLALIESADILTENFRAGAFDSYGLGYDELKAINPRLIYCSLKGFLSGPYENRTALDEVVQMMGGLAFMTGPPGHPSRAGASVNDIMGGMFGVIGILSALLQRKTTGKGSVVKSGLFENCVLLMAQHISRFERTGIPSEPLFNRNGVPWPVYDLFFAKDKRQIFVALVTESQWQRCCTEFEFNGLLRDPDLQDNASRVAARDRILALYSKKFGELALEEIIGRLEKVGCPYAPVVSPDDLLDDFHLNQSDGFLNVEIDPGRIGKIPGLPLQYNGQRPPLRMQPPLVGEHSRELLQSVGYSDQDIDEMIESDLLTVSSRELDRE